MNILIYLPILSKTTGGTYQYSIALLNTLAKDVENNYYIFKDIYSEEIKEILSGSNFKIIDKINGKYSIFKSILYKFYNLFNKILYKLRLPIKFKIESSLSKTIKKYKIDVIHCPYQYLPDCNIPKISTIHDFQELHYPEFFTSQERINRAINNKNIIDNSSAIIVSYEHVKRDIIKFFDRKAEDINIVLLNMNNLWFNNIKSETIKNIDNLNIPEKYLLYPAATWPHKNHLRLLEAIAYIKNKKNIKINLVCTGNKTNNYYEKIENLLISLNIEDQVLFKGIVDDESLYLLYQKTTGVVIPTLYEAGSFPLMECILMNIPVICSNVTSLPETISNIEFIFNPTDIEDMSNKIISIYTDDNYRDLCKKNNSLVKDKIINTNALEKFNIIYDKLKRNHNQFVK